jgi:hypothetical protein
MDDVSNASRALLGLVLLLPAFACSSEADPGIVVGGSSGGSGGGGSDGGGSGGGSAGGAAGGGAGGTAGVGGSLQAGSGGLTSGGSGGGAGAATGGAAAGSGGGGAGGSPGGDAGGTGGGSGGAGGGSACPGSGSITYTLAKAPQPTEQQQNAYDLITEAMDEAISFYNCYTDIERTLNVTYNPDVATADGNENGSIRFGQTPYMNHITAMHEISHVVGIGNPTFDSMTNDGIFSGETATATLRSITGNPEDEVHGDDQHFWPYGLNQTSEVGSDQDLIDHCKMVLAIRVDLGF